MIEISFIPRSGRTTRFIEELQGRPCIIVHDNEYRRALRDLISERRGRDFMERTHFAIVANPQDVSHRIGSSIFINFTFDHATFEAWDDETRNAAMEMIRKRRWSFDEGNTFKFVFDRRGGDA